MNDHAIRRTREAIEEIAAKHDLTVERVVVYGSYARGDDEASDLDIVVVCPEWADEDDYYARPIPLLLEWPRGELPVPDIVPLSPEEFERRSNAAHDVVRTAARTGIVVEP